MKRLKAEFNGFKVYQAGLPNFPRNFTRDSIISAILMEDSEMLADQLSFCAFKQGKKINPYTGEEEGKIFHEYPGFEINKQSTEFNACDTTAMYLIGHEFYQKFTGDKMFAEKSQKNIEKAVGYILSHLKNSFFIEDPKFVGTKDFALKATYWKDSGVLGRKNEKPEYPIVYTLAHIQNMRGLRSATNLLNSNKLENVTKEMSKSLEKLYDSEKDCFYIAIDNQGPIKAVSSDPLHSLFYLNREDLSKEKLEGIVSSSRELETPIGYRTLNPLVAESMKDKYHASTVWPFEQAIIHAGAKKFGLEKIEKISERIIPYLDSAPEIFILENKEIRKGGCDPQLWTIATKKYFEKQKLKHF